MINDEAGTIYLLNEGLYFTHMCVRACVTYKYWLLEVGLGVNTEYCDIGIILFIHSIYIITYEPLSRPIFSNSVPL